MPNTVLFPVHQQIQDSMNQSIVHVDGKSSEDHLVASTVDNTAEAQKVAALQSGNDWYQNDLSHMTMNLMRDTSNTTALTPSNQQSLMQSRDIGLINNNVVIGNTTITSGDGSIIVNINHSGGGKVDTYDVANKAAQIDSMFMRMLGRHPDEKALSYNLFQLLDNTESLFNLQHEMAYSEEIKINIKAIGKSILGYEPDEKRIAAVQKELSGYAASNGDIAKIFEGKPVEKILLDTTRVNGKNLNTASLAHEIATINNMYVNLLGYNADPGGLGFYLGEKVNNSQSFADIQRKIAYAPDAYKHIQTLGNSILGYNPDDAWIKQIQKEVSVFGKGQQDIRNNFINSQAGTNAIITMGSNLLGRAVTDQTDHNWIEAIRAQEVQGASLSALRIQQAHGSLGDAVSKQIFSNLLGRSATANDIPWLNAVKDQLASGQTYQQILSQQAHGGLGDAVSKQIFSNLLGRSATANDIPWLNAVKDQLASGQTYQQILSQQAHGGLGDAVSKQIFSNLLGRSATANDIPWLNAVKDQLASGQTYQQILSQQAHGGLGDAVSKQIFSNLLGRSATANDIPWLNAVKDQLASGQTYQQILSQQAHGGLGDAVSKELLQKIYKRPATAGDTAWLNMVKNQLAGGKTYQQILRENT